MKKLSVLEVIILAGALLIPGATYASDNITIRVNGNILQDANSYVVDGVTMLPLRKVGESLNAKVDYTTYKGYPQITLSKGNNTVFIIDDLISKNGEIKTLSKPVASKNDTTYVALRDVAEALDVNVDFDAASNTIKLSEKRLSAESLEAIKGTIRKDFETFSKDFIINLINNNYTGYREVTSQTDKNILVQYVNQLDAQKQANDKAKEAAKEAEAAKEQKKLDKEKREEEAEKQRVENAFKIASTMIRIDSWEHFYEDTYKIKVVNDSGNDLLKFVVRDKNGREEVYHSGVNGHSSGSYLLKNLDMFSLTIEALEFDIK